MTSFFTNVLRFRLLIAAAAIGVLTLGVLQLRQSGRRASGVHARRMRRSRPRPSGLSAEEVEQLITVPLEADLLNGVEGVEVIRSESVPGLSSIVLVFEPGTDVYRARQLVQERLTQAHALPNVSKPPTLLQPLSSSSRVLMIGLSLDRADPDRAVGDRPLDRPAAADGRARAWPTSRSGACGTSSSRSRSTPSSCGAATSP